VFTGWTSCYMLAITCKCSCNCCSLIILLSFAVLLSTIVLSVFLAGTLLFQYLPQEMCLLTEFLMLPVVHCNNILFSHNCMHSNNYSTLPLIDKFYHIMISTQLFVAH